MQVQYGSPIAYTLPARDAGGVVVVGAPTQPNHAATKKYVDDAVANAGGGGLYYHQITISLFDYYYTDCGGEIGSKGSVHF
jgi:ABC-type sugar transport system substrate-binding protein